MIPGQAYTTHVACRWLSGLSDSWSTFPVHSTQHQLHQPGQWPGWYLQNWFCKTPGGSSAPLTASCKTLRRVPTPLHPTPLQLTPFGRCLELVTFHPNGHFLWDFIIGINSFLFLYPRMFLFSGPATNTHHSHIISMVDEIRLKIHKFHLFRHGILRPNSSHTGAIMLPTNGNGRLLLTALFFLTDAL